LNRERYETEEVVRNRAFLKDMYLLQLLKYIKAKVNWPYIFEK